MKVYDIIKSAEELYIEEINKRKYSTYPGMCWCLKVAARNMAYKEKGKETFPFYRELIANIPEFNPKFLKATAIVKTAGLDFWWALNDKQSRFNAFRLLRSIYKHSNKEFIY